MLIRNSSSTQTAIYLDAEVLHVRRHIARTYQRQSSACFFANNRNQGIIRHNFSMMGMIVDIIIMTTSIHKDLLPIYV